MAGSYQSIFEGTQMDERWTLAYSAVQRIFVNGQQATKEGTDVELTVVEQEVVDAILALIPTAATASNKLTDKAYVDSSIATAAATFRGTSPEGLTQAQFLAWANALEHDKNDTVFWKTTDTVGNTLYKKYKFNGSSWAFEYDLNNSSFTASQWAAINSGLTATLLETLSTRAGEGHTAYGYFTNGKLPYASISGAPTELPNPEALSWSGYSSGSYDGSEAAEITIPDNTNQLTNGAGFITSSALTPYALKTWVDTKVEPLQAFVDMFEYNATTRTLILKKDGNNDRHFAAYGDISAGGVGQGGSSTGGVASIILNGATVLPDVDGKANLGSLATAAQHNALAGRVTVLEGKATAVSYTPAVTSGTALGTITIDSVGHTIYAPTIPTALKNPTSLSWSGYSSGSYDGSEAKSISIPNNTNQLTNGAGFITGITSSMVTTALGYTPVNKAGDTMNGVLTISPVNTSGNQDGLILHDSGGGASESLYIKWTSNSYTSGIRLSSNTDKTQLVINNTYTIYHEGNLTASTLGLGNVENKSSATIRSEIVASNIPSLDASKITTGQFADARIASASAWNAKWDYNENTIKAVKVNNAGNADTLENHSASYFATASSLGNYLPLSGGTMTGPLIIKTNDDNSLVIDENQGEKFHNILFLASGVEYARLTANQIHYNTPTLLFNNNIVYHSGNSNRTDTPWNASSLTLNGAISGATSITASGNITAASLVKIGGTSGQFLKADGSVDGTQYSGLRELGYFGDYTTIVVALCEITAAYTSGPTFWQGRILNNRSNGLIPMYSADVVFKASWSAEAHYYLSTSLERTNANGFRFCTFIYNGKTYAGLECYMDQASTYYAEGTGNFTPFAIVASSVSSISYSGGNRLSSYFGNVLASGSVTAASLSTSGSLSAGATTLSSLTVTGNATIGGNILRTTTGQSIGTSAAPWGAIHANKWYPNANDTTNYIEYTGTGFLIHGNVAATGDVTAGS